MVQFLLLGFLVFLSVYFTIAYLLWRNLKLYNIPGAVLPPKLNIVFLIITFFFITWAAIALFKFS